VIVKFSARSLNLELNDACIPRSIGNLSMSDSPNAFNNGFAGKKVIVQFDGIYHDSKVYLNGTQVGGQQYGYVSFTCDLTPYLNATGDNVLAVFVDNLTVRNSRWYSGTGIYRHVWLIATDKVYIRNWGTAVTTPTVSTAQSQVSVQIDVVNELTTAQTRTLETVIYDEAGSELSNASTPVTVAASSTGTYTQNVTLSSVTLWSPSTPVRYYAYSQLLNNASLADDYVTPFGIRELKYTPGTGLTINGVSTKMKGVCIHHTLVPAGAAVADSMWERAIKEVKASGASSIRTSHNPYSPEFYDICDEQGMLVLDEFTDKWSQPASAGGVTYENWDANWQNDVKLFIERDRNHPSVVMWSMGNEVYYGGTIPAYITTTMGQLVPYVHALDKGSSRPVLHACNVQDPAGYVNLAKIQDDFAGINYGDSIYSQIHSLDPNVLVMGTENDPYTIPGSLLPTWFSVKNTPYVVGHHIWTAWDYLGEKPPLGSAYGYLDNCIFRKSYFYYQQSQWSDAPMVHVTIGNGSGSGRTMPPLAEDWNQSGSVDVTTYTNCDSVDLYVNSTKIGTKNLSDFPNMIMVWPSVPWTTGTIKAVGMKGGVQVAVDSINTAGAAAKTSAVWKTYRSPDYGFKIDYPESMNFYSGHPVRPPEISMFPICDGTTIACFQYNGDALKETTTQAVGISVNVLRDARSESECNSIDTGSSPIKTAKIHGAKFHFGDESEAGLGSSRSMTEYRTLYQHVCFEVAVLVTFPAAAPAGFIAARFGLGTVERLVVHHFEAIQADIVDGCLLRFGHLLPRPFDFGTQALQFLTRRAREQGAMFCLDGGRRIAVRAMHDVRAGQHADDHQVALVLIEFGDIIGQAEQDLVAAGNLRHQAEVLGEGGQIERFGGDGKAANNVKSLGRPAAGNA